MMGKPPNPPGGNADDAHAAIRAEADAARAPAVDDIHAQHARILAHLKAHGCTSCADLAAACDVPSVTRRVCDLIAAGWPVARMRGRVRESRGAR